MPTRQETFDTVARHLLTQGCRSEDGDGNCRYRGLDGLKCAAGCLIPDEKYYVALEGKALVVDGRLGTLDVHTLEQQYALREALEGHDVDLVTELQLLHDLNDVSEWADALRETARRYALSSKAVDVLEGTV